MRRKMIGPFSGDQKPVRDGVYLRVLEDGTAVWAKWHKCMWLCHDNKIAKAATSVWPSSYQDTLEWYGVANG